MHHLTYKPFSNHYLTSKQSSIHDQFRADHCFKGLISRNSK